jgi:hypothetical protein
MNPVESWLCCEGHAASGTKHYEARGGYRYIDFRSWLSPIAYYVPLKLDGPYCNIHAPTLPKF